MRVAERIDHLNGQGGIHAGERFGEPGEFFLGESRAQDALGVAAVGGCPTLTVDGQHTVENRNNRQVPVFFGARNSRVGEAFANVCLALVPGLVHVKEFFVPAPHNFAGFGVNKQPARFGGGLIPGAFVEGFTREIAREHARRFGGANVHVGVGAHLLQQAMPVVERFCGTVCGVF